MWVLSILAGMFIGMVLTVIGVKRLDAGDLRVDQSDPSEPPYLFLELKKPVDKVCRKEYVLLKINVENYISHD